MSRMTKLLVKGAALDLIALDAEATEPSVKSDLSRRNGSSTAVALTTWTGLVSTAPCQHIACTGPSPLTQTSQSRQSRLGSDRRRCAKFMGALYHEISKETSNTQLISSLALKRAATRSIKTGVSAEVWTTAFSKSFKPIESIKQNSFFLDVAERGGIFGGPGASVFAPPDDLPYLDLSGFVRHCWRKFRLTPLGRPRPRGMTWTLTTVRSLLAERARRSDTSPFIEFVRQWLSKSFIASVARMKLIGTTDL